MGGVAIGPLVFSADRAPVIVALLILVITTTLIARKTGPEISHWATGAALAAAVVARLGFVGANFAVYRADPLAIFAFWQGGFSLIWGVVGFAGASAWYLARQRALFLPAVASVLFAVAGWNVVHQLTRAETANLPENILLTSLGGDPVVPGDWLGTPMVINLWATWCPPCRREMPMMAEIAAQDTGAALHFVNQGEAADIVRRYLSQENLLIAPVLDPGMQMMPHFGALGLPATLFISADGRLQSAHMGEISRAQLLAQIEALKETRP